MFNTMLNKQPGRALTASLGWARSSRSVMTKNIVLWLGSCDGFINFIGRLNVNGINQFYSYSASFLRTYCDSGDSGCGDAGKLSKEDGEVQDASSRDNFKDETLSLFWNSFYQKMNALYGWPGILLWFLVQLGWSYLLVLCLKNTGSFDKALCQPSSEGSLGALFRSPVSSPIDWNDILGGSETGESGVPAPREELAHEAEAGPVSPEVQAGGEERLRAAGEEAFLRRLQVPPKTLRDLAEELHIRSLRARDLFAEQGLKNPFEDPRSGDDFQRECLARWELQLLIREKLKLLLRKHFGIKEGVRFYNLLHTLLHFPLFALSEQSLPDLRATYRRMEEDPDFLRAVLEIIQADLDSGGFRPNKRGRYPHI